MRLVLVNVPKPELIIRELVSLVRPGGWVASCEADLAAVPLDPPSPEWDRLLRLPRACRVAVNRSVCRPTDAPYVPRSGIDGHRG